MESAAVSFTCPYVICDVVCRLSVVCLTVQWKKIDRFNARTWMVYVLCHNYRFPVLENLIDFYVSVHCVYTLSLHNYSLWLYDISFETIVQVHWPCIAGNNHRTSVYCMLPCVKPAINKGYTPSNNSNNLESVAVSFTYPWYFSFDVDISSIFCKVSHCISISTAGCRMQGSPLMERNKPSMSLSLKTVKML